MKEKTILETRALWEFMGQISSELTETVIKE